LLEPAGWPTINKPNSATIGGCRQDTDTPFVADNGYPVANRPEVLQVPGYITMVVPLSSLYFLRALSTRLFAPLSFPGRFGLQTRASERLQSPWPTNLLLIASAELLRFLLGAGTADLQLLHIVPCLFFDCILVPPLMHHRDLLRYFS
jgi:hypothetical protein